MKIQQSTTAYSLVFLMVDSTDHVTGKTGLSPTVTIRKTGGSFASPAGAVTEIANGWYQVAGNATDNNTLGPLLLHATASGADPTDTSFEVVIQDLTTASVTVGSLPFSALDAAFLRAIGVIHVGTFASGSVSSGTLNSGGTPAAINDDDQYNGNSVIVYSTAGVFKGTATIDDQTGLALTFGNSIDDAVVSTDIAVIIATPQGLTAAGLAAAVWGALTASYSTASTFGGTMATSTAQTTAQADLDDIQTRLPAALSATGGIKADMIGVSGDATAADNFEAMLDGTGGVTLSAALPSTERNAFADALILRPIDGAGASSRLVKDVFAMGRNKWTFDATTGALVVYDYDDTTILWTGTGSFASASRNAVIALDPAG